MDAPCTRQQLGGAVITFAEARAIVQIEVPTAQIVATWGYESDTYWQLIAGDTRFINGNQLDYSDISDTCHLVRKSDGHYETKSFVAAFNFFEGFTPYGNIPMLVQD